MLPITYTFFIQYILEPETTERIELLDTILIELLDTILIELLNTVRTEILFQMR